MHYDRNRTHLKNVNDLILVIIFFGDLSDINYINYLHVGKGCSISGRVGNAKENSLVYVIIYSLFIMSFYFF